MSLETIKDFDFGVGPKFTASQRVSTSPRDVSKPERDFILWLMLEQEFYRRKVRRTDDEDIRKSTTTTSKARNRLEDIDEDDGDDGQHHLRVPKSKDRNSDREKLRIAKEYADATLRAAGINLLLEDLGEKHRHSMLIQLCRSCELIPGDSIRSAPEIFHQLSKSKFRSSFDVVKKLGRGGYGEVFHVTSKATDSSRPKNFAVKKTSVSLDSLVDLEMLEDDLNLALNESKFLKRLKGHRRIVELFDYWLEIESDENNPAPSATRLNEYDEDEFVGPLKFYIQLEFLGESLETWKDNPENILDTSLVISLASQLFDGLSHIHRNGIMHLDINPKNILWKDSECREIKIVDFGLACDSKTFEEKCGTPPYVDPDYPMTPKSDIYSAAVTIVEVAKKIRTKQELVDLIKSKNVSLGESVLDDMMLKSINSKGANRPSAVEVRDRLNAASRGLDFAVIQDGINYVHL